nr:phospholipase-like protein [Tanacetum cinerariifolium]
EKFCLVSGLKFGVENSTDYNKAKDPIPFRRRVFSSDLDGRPIRGKDVLLLIESDAFKRLEDNDAVSLCCVGILQLVLLGVEDRRPVPNWILRLANDRVSWEKGYQQMKEKNVDMYEKLTRFIEDMRRVPEANTTPIIADQHFDGAPSAFNTLANNSSFFNMPTPSNLQTPHQSNWLSQSNWQTPNQSYLGTLNSQPPIPSQPDTSNWQNPMTSRHHDAGILDPNLCDRARREPQPSVYMLSPYTNLPPTTVLTKKSTWVQILIRERTENANWTLAKSGTVCLHPENNRFMILTDSHNIGTLDGSMRHFLSWNDVTWVYMPINAGGVHWVTGAINMTCSIFYVFDSMESESRMLMLEQQVNN